MENKIKKAIMIMFGWFVAMFILGWFCPLNADTLPIPGHTKICGWFYEKRIDSEGRVYQHGALDFPANLGTPYRAVRSGIVSHAILQTRDDRGHWVEILCDDGTSDLYFHSQAIFVKKGQRVNEGDYIGTVGCTGHSYGPHLHIQRNDENDRPIYTTDKFGVVFTIIPGRLQ